MRVINLTNMKSLSNITAAVISIAETLLNYAIDIVRFIVRKAGEFAILTWNWFLELPLFEKLIIFNGIPAMLAALLPVAQFPIFDSYHIIQNPLAHLVILLGLYMFGSIFLRRNGWFVIGRFVFCIYYFIRVVYVSFADNAITFSKEYTMSGSFVINYIVPVVYLLLTFLSWKSENR
jgi:hypothetical protein